DRAGHALAGECIFRFGRGHDDERLGSKGANCVEHPVDETLAEQRVKMLRCLGAHPRPEPGGHDDGCELSIGHGFGSSWGARIRTWDRGTKTRCLTTWLRPTTVRLSPETGVNTAARAKPAQPLSRRCKQRLSTWLRPTAGSVTSVWRSPEESSRASRER